MRRIASLGMLLLAGCAGARSPRCAPCAPEAPPALDVEADPTRDVDPLIGTGGHGHTFPGATVPFGMVQLSPDTRLEGWDGCSGYHHSDSTIYGFTHTHLSGTGCSDYGDVLLVPTVGPTPWNDGADGKPGYRSRFSHERERAEAGAYEVFLDDPGVRVELTATARAGLHRYTFPATEEANVLLDLAHRDEVLESSVEVSGPAELRGMRRSRAWAQNQPVYFVARFSRPFEGFQLAVDGKEVAGARAEGKDVRARVRFATRCDPTVVVAVGLSSVDLDGAARNLDAEVGCEGFDAVRERARDAWRAQLGKATVSGGTPAQRRTFATALYHACLAPNVFSDVDGRYLGMDGKVHRAEGYVQHTVFSLWDTFRAEHPLLTILEPDRTNDFVRTFLADRAQGGALPVWELWGNETGCMIGYHAVPVIADAFAKGIRGYDGAAALEAMTHSALDDRLGLKAYRERGFIPSEEEGESVSKTLEYAYDDACIAWTATALGRTDTARTFLRRAKSWVNLFDPASAFLRARRNGAFVEPFEPSEVNFHYTEANAWQYSAFVPQDTDALIRLHGGRERFAAWLDRLFAAPAATTGREQPDISGMIGQYAHGNEPSHHVAYLYCHAGQPWKTQQRVRQILDTLYSDRPDGLCGNEDCGQMSAWYVLSALGFYPVTPGIPEYVLGSPLFPEATIRLQSGRRFTIRANGVGPDAPYVQRATLDGVALDRPVLSHAAIVAGGELVLEMGPRPSAWGSAEAGLPRTSIDDPGFVPVPFLTRGERVFHGTTEIALGTADPASEIRVSLDGGATFSPFTAPLRLERTTALLAYGARAGHESPRLSARFVRIPHDRTIALATRFAPQYAANGDVTLIDGLHGGPDFRTGDWQGYEGKDLDATIDLGKAQDVRTVSTGFLQDQRSWIFLPVEVTVTVSDDGKDFRPFGQASSDVDEHAKDTVLHAFEVQAEARARFVRVVAKNRGTCPDWHPGAGHPSWIFADEIEILPAQ